VQKYESDVIVFRNAVVVMQSQAGDVKVHVHAKETGQLIQSLAVTTGSFEKKLGFAAGWLWAWSGAEGHSPTLFQFEVYEMS